MKKIWRNVLGWFGLSYQQFQLMTSDGTEPLNLDGIRCRRCQNYFWVEDAAIEMPGYCCYCGTQFLKIEVMGNAEFDRACEDSN